MFLCQVLVLNFILFQAPVVRSSGSAWSFLTSSSTKPHDIGAADVDVRHSPQSLLPGVPPYATGPYRGKGAEASHHEALRLLKALGSRSSCHGEATSSLLVDCAALEGDALDVNVKISYAVRLAICEFKSTGVSYPSECKRLGSSGAYKPTPAQQKCIKKLEEKPQHWTTLSNNIQNVVALCAAARHEIDKKELLSLHINITKIQQGLFNAVHTQLNEAWEAMQAQRIWDAEIKASQRDALDTLHQLKESAINTLRGSNDQASSIIGELAKQLQLSKESSNILSDELKKSIQTLTESTTEIFLRIPIAWNQMEESIREMTNGQIGTLQESGRLARQLQDSLESSRAFMVDNLEISMGHLSATVSETLTLLRNAQMTSMSISESFTSLSSSYRSLESTEYELTSSLQLQQSLHNQMLSSIEKASEVTDHSMAALVEEIERLRDTVQVVERKVHSFWRWELPQKSILTTGILAIFLIVVLIGGKQITWGVGIFSGLWALAMATVLIDEPYYLSNNSGSTTNMEKFRLAGPELPMTTNKSHQLPFHTRASVVVGGFTLLAFYFSRYYRYWGGRKASLSSENRRHLTAQQGLGAPRRRKINDICIF